MQRHVYYTSYKHSQTKIHVNKYVNRLYNYIYIYIRTRVHTGYTLYIIMCIKRMYIWTNENEPT